MVSWVVQWVGQVAIQPNNNSICSNLCHRVEVACHFTPNAHAQITDFTLLQTATSVIVTGIKGKVKQSITQQFEFQSFQILANSK